MRLSQRGVTLLEMVVTLGLMSIVMGGIVMFLATHSRMAAGTFDRTDIQRSGRGALSVLEEKLGSAGMGLPKGLAIKSYAAIDGVTANACANSPRLEVAALNFLQQWDVTGTTGDDATGVINLAAMTNGPPPNPNPGGIAGDVAIPNNQWLFIYTTASQDLTSTPSFGAERGHGMVLTGATRAIGGAAIAIAAGGTDYSGAQDALNLANISEINNIAGRGSVVMMADVSAFGMNCEDPNHPYLYWENNGAQTPVASNVATPAIGGVLGLSFRFFLDLNGPDGVPDGVGEVWDDDGTNPTPGVLTIDPDPAVGEHDNVTAIQVTLTLRSDTPDPQLEAYRTETFTMTIQTVNIHTRVDAGDTSHLGRYFFVENSGI